MDNKVFCHMCGNETDWVCQDCDEPVCEECAVPYDQFTRIDYTLCESCHEGSIAASQFEAYREEEREEEARAKRDARNKAARQRYWLPENVAKRKKAREERKRMRAEQKRRMFANAFRIVGEMLR